jgi:hypothetical protein
MNRLLLAVVVSVLLPAALLAGVSARAWQLDHPTPLMFAAQQGDLTKVDELLDRGGDVNEQNKKGRATPLIFAASAGKADVVKLLLKRGANPNLCSWENVCPIWWAVYSKSFDAIKTLIDVGANVNVNPGVNALEFPTLHLAVGSGRSDIVTLLLDSGIATEYTNFLAKNTALAHAVKDGHAAIARILIERGADLGAVTEVPFSESFEYGTQSALEIAKKNGHTAAVKVVEDALRSGKYARPLYTVDAIIDRLYRDPTYDLSVQDKGQADFLRLQAPETLRRIRNTIFARKNYRFDDRRLIEYFRQRFSSYKALMREYEMSDVDKRNVKYLMDIEALRTEKNAAG